MISDTVGYDLNSEINERNTYTRNIGCLLYEKMTAGAVVKTWFDMYLNLIVSGIQ